LLFSHAQNAFCGTWHDIVVLLKYAGGRKRATVRCLDVSLLDDGNLPQIGLSIAQARWLLLVFRHQLCGCRFTYLIWRHFHSLTDCRTHHCEIHIQGDFVSGVPVWGYIVLIERVSEIKKPGNPFQE